MVGRQKGGKLGILALAAPAPALGVYLLLIYNIYLYLISRQRSVRIHPSTIKASHYSRNPILLQPVVT